MPRRSKAEYIKVRRQRYEVASPARKSRIIRRQEEYTTARKVHDRIYLESAAADSSLRDAPSGASSACALQIGGIDLRPNPLSKQKQHLQSTQYLTNRKAPAYLLGTQSI